MPRTSSPRSDLGAYSDDNDAFGYVDLANVPIPEASWINARNIERPSGVLREQLGSRRLRFTDERRRRLAAKGRALGRTVLHALGGIVTPDTILRWYREIIASGRPGSHAPRP